MSPGYVRECSHCPPQPQSGNTDRPPTAEQMNAKPLQALGWSGAPPRPPATLLSAAVGRAPASTWDSGPLGPGRGPDRSGEKQSRAAGQAALLPQPLMAISWISDLSGRLASSSPSREPTQTDPSPIRGWHPGSSTIPPYTPSPQAPPPPPRPPVTSPSFPPVIQPPSSAVSPSPRSNPAAPGSFSLNILFSSAAPPPHAQRGQ